MSDDHPNQVWTGGWNSFFHPYLAKSEDGGETWKRLSENISTNSEGSVYGVTISPDNAEIVLATISGVIRKTEDSGETWETVLEGYDIRVLKNSGLQPNRVYASGLSAQEQLFIAISDDYGDSWDIEIYEDSPANLQTYAMAVAEVNGNETLFLGTTKGVYSLTFEE